MYRAGRPAALREVPSVVVSDTDRATDRWLAHDIHATNDFLFSGEWWITIFPRARVLTAPSGDLLVTGFSMRRVPLALMTRWRLCP